MPQTGGKRKQRGGEMEPLFIQGGSAAEFPSAYGAAQAGGIGPITPPSGGGSRRVRRVSRRKGHARKARTHTTSAGGSKKRKSKSKKHGGSKKRSGKSRKH